MFRLALCLLIPKFLTLTLYLSINYLNKPSLKTYCALGFEVLILKTQSLPSESSQLVKREKSINYNSSKLHITCVGDGGTIYRPGWEWVDAEIS